MGALGDFFQGAYAYTEQERLRQVEEDNKFKLYEKQQRLVNALADEDRKTEVARTQEMPELGKIFFFNADGQKIGETDMDKIAQQTARSAGAKAETDQAKSALDLFINEQTGLSSAQADIRYKDAAADQASGLADYYRAGGSAGAKEPELTPGQKDAIGKEAYELESELRVGLADFLEMNQGALHSNNKAAREAAPGRSGEAQSIAQLLSAVTRIQDPVQRRDALRDLQVRARELKLLTE